MLFRLPFPFPFLSARPFVCAYAKALLVGWVCLSSITYRRNMGGGKRRGGKGPPPRNRSVTTLPHYHHLLLLLLLLFVTVLTSTCERGSGEDALLPTRKTKNIPGSSLQPKLFLLHLVVFRVFDYYFITAFIVVFLVGKKASSLLRQLLLLLMHVGRP